MSGDETGIPFLVKTLVSAVKWLALLSLMLMLALGVMVLYIARGA